MTYPTPLTRNRFASKPRRPVRLMFRGKRLCEASCPYRQAGNGFILCWSDMPSLGLCSQLPGCKWLSMRASETQDYSS